MKKHKISVAIATHNEEKNIRQCLGSLNHFADEVVIADGASKDNTVDLAKKMGAKVIKTSNKPMFHINKNLAIENCVGDWVILLDADERLTDDLKKEILETINANPSENAFWINRKNWFVGGFLEKGGAYPDSVIRLFRRGKARLPEVSVHEQLKVTGEIGHLNNPLLHFADPDFSRYLYRANRYTDLTAQKILNENPGKSIFTILNYMLVKPLFTFCSLYFRHKGYQDGFRGFIWALLSGFHFFYAYTKYWSSNSH